jgi:hypothetical protein
MTQYFIRGCDTYYRFDCQYKEDAEFANDQEAWQYCDDLFPDDDYQLYRRNQIGIAIEIFKT